jgi:hypothetical protein
MSLPRFFVAAGDAPLAVTLPGAVTHALDVFVLKGLEQEWLVGSGNDGALTAQPVEPRRALPKTVQAQLSFHEACGLPVRIVPARSLHLFEAHLLAQAPDLPGINDPVFVHGNLLGPLGDPTRQAMRVAGHLTLTRMDVLHGLVGGAATAFRHADRSTGTATRTFHALLPGDRPERLRRGEGAVLAYPLSDPELGGEVTGNEALVDELLYGLLRAVWQDVAREYPPPQREPDRLPLPSRSVLERELVSDGFTINGNYAVRPRAGLMGRLLPERRWLPAQGDTNGFLALAQEALTTLPWWPRPRIEALVAPWPRPAPRALPSTEKPRGEPPAGWKQDWIQRFIQAQEERERGKEPKPGG